MSQPDDELRFFEAPPKSGPEQLVGTVVAGRQIQRLLGVGAMGAVYLAKHLKMGRLEAIKVLHDKLARDPDAMARFDRGARNISSIRHTNVCTIYDFSDTDGGVQFVAMEYVDGEALLDLLDREGSLPLDRGLSIAIQAADALQAAHNVGVIHRDLKPANIMIVRGLKGEDIVKVVDFDISKAAGDTEEREITRLGSVVGTPEYMSPEQLWGGKLDGRSDVYSLALVLYRILTGQLPFRSDTLHEVMHGRLSDAPLLRLDELARGKSFPPELQEVLNSALRRNADERTPSAGEFAEQLRALQPAPATRVGPTLATLREPAGKLKLVLVAAAVAAVSIAGALVALNGASRDRAPSQARPVDAIRDGGSGGPPPSSGAGENRTGTSPDQTGGLAGDRRLGEAPSGVHSMFIAPEQVQSILDSQRDRLAGATPPAAKALAAMRDTASVIFALPGISTAQKARAAFLAGQASLHLKEKETCSRWAARAVALMPNSASYPVLVTSCAGIQSE